MELDPAHLVVIYRMHLQVRRQDAPERLVPYRKLHAGSYRFLSGGHLLLHGRAHHVEAI